MEMRRRCAREDDEDDRWCRQCLSKPCRWFAGWRPEKEETVSRVYRDAGFYWVRREEDAELEVAHLTEEGWEGNAVREWRFSSGDTETYHPDGWGFYWIGERIDPPKDAR